MLGSGRNWCSNFCFCFQRHDSERTPVSSCMVCRVFLWIHSCGAQHNDCAYMRSNVYMCMYYVLEQCVVHHQEVAQFSWWVRNALWDHSMTSIPHQIWQAKRSFSMQESSSCVCVLNIFLSNKFIQPGHNEIPIVSCSSAFLQCLYTRSYYALMIWHSPSRPRSTGVAGLKPCTCPLCDDWSTLVMFGIGLHCKLLVSKPVSALT